MVDAFWDAVEGIGLEKLNHARSAERIAINLVHFQREAVEEKVAAPALEDLRRSLRLSTSPRFIEVVTVKSVRVARSVKCWEFSKDSKVEQ